MKILTSITLFFLPGLMFAQRIDWQNTSGWKLYSIFTDRGLKLQVDSLKVLAYASLDSDSAMGYLRSATLLEKDKRYIWMGAYYATYIMDSTEYKVDISMYGGFFYDESSKRYYQLKENKRDAWLAWLNNAAKPLLLQK